jgi:DNA-binding transcriptional LysR family regulator
MQTMELDWDDLRHFLAVARGGSLAAAGRALRVDQTTVGRRIAALERTLGARLFDRRVSGYPLTAVGESIVAEAAAVEAAVHGLEMRAAGHDTRREGAVRVATSETFAHYLVERLAPFRRGHPGIALQIRTGTAQVDLLRHEADLALRIGGRARPTQGTLVARRLGEIGLSLYRTDRGDARDFILFSDDMEDTPPGRWVRERAGGRAALRVNSFFAAAGAAVAGIGVALLPCFLGDAYPSLRRAIAVPPLHNELWLVVPRDLQKVPRVRALIDHLHTVISADRRLLRGDRPGR